MAAIEELASRVFAARDVAHRAHWATRSYAAHKALNEFYDGIVDAIDALVEAYQGQFGLIGSFSVSTPLVGDMVQFLMAEIDWIEANRADITRGSPALGNLLDAVVNDYQTAAYMLRTFP